MRRVEYRILYRVKESRRRTREGGRGMGGGMNIKGGVQGPLLVAGVLHSQNKVINAP